MRAILEKEAHKHGKLCMTASCHPAESTFNRQETYLYAEASEGSASASRRTAPELLELEAKPLTPPILERGIKACRRVARP